MAICDQVITGDYALYCGDCVSTMRHFVESSIHLTVYSPPFAGLYQYSSDPQDMSNAIDKDEFFQHYGYCVAEIARLTMPGRISAVHCMDIPLSNSGCDEMFPLGDEIRSIHKEHGFAYAGQRVIWKEPLMVRNRTMMKSLHHKTFVEDTTRTSVANADYLLMFRRNGENPIPVVKENGIMSYAGEREPPAHLSHMRGMKGDQKQNQYSQWIWRQYASSVWMDIRIDRVLAHRSARDAEDEKHVHPLQLDVIERCVSMWSNPGETVLTPFMGVGSEVYSAVSLGRKGIGVELKPSYYRQAVRNVKAALEGSVATETPLLVGFGDEEE